MSCHACCLELTKLSKQNYKILSERKYTTFMELQLIFKKSFSLGREYIMERKKIFKHEDVEVEGVIRPWKENRNVNIIF